MDEDGRPRVLLVDDEELLLRSLARVLTRAGFEVVSHQTLAGARAALRDDAGYDVVLTDLRIGMTTGLDLIPIAAGRDPRPGVIVFSGAASDDDIDAALAAGAVAVIRKPIQPADLVAAVEAAVKR